MSQQWMGTVIGGYFASMGMFGFGCASGNCIRDYSAEEPKNRSTIPNVDSNTREALKPESWGNEPQV